MTTLEQAVNGTVSNSTITVREVMKYSSFFKDGKGNRYTLQMTGEECTKLGDEYALYRDHHFNPIGLCVYEDEKVTLITKHAMNVCCVLVNDIELYPFIEKPVML